MQKQIIEQPRYAVAGSSWDRSYRGGDDGTPVLDFSYVFRIIRRRIKLILLVVLIALGVAGVLLVNTTPNYTASARLIIEEPNVDVLQTDSVLSDPSLDTPLADGQLQILGSANVIGRVVADLDLLSNPEFTRRNFGPIRGVRAAISNALRNVPFLAPVIADHAQAMTLDGAVEKIQDHSHVRRVGLSYVFVVDVNWSSPELAARIANGIAQAYIADRVERRQAETEAATSWLAKRLEELQQTTIAKNAAVAKFKADNNIVGAGREGLLVEQQLSTLNAQIAKASLQSQDAQEALNRFSDVTTNNIVNAPLTANAEDQNLSTLRDQLLAVQARRAQLAQRYGETHSVTRKADEDIFLLQARIETEINRVRELLRSDYASAKRSENALRTQLAALTKKVSAVGGAQVRLQVLESEASVYQSLFDGYLQRYMQSVQQQSLPGSDARVIAAATPPEYDDVSGTSIALMALSLGLSLGFAAALVRERMDRTVRTPDQLRMASGMPALGLLPRTREAVKVAKPITRPDAPGYLIKKPFGIGDPRYNQVVRDPLSRYTETIRRIKVAVDGSHANLPCLTVGFISSENAPIRGMAAANYAQLMASSGKSTLLLDLDFRNATLSKALTPQANVGFLECSLAGSADDLQSAIWSDVVSNVDFLPAGNSRHFADGAHKVSFVSVERLAKLLVHLANDYQCIVLDLPALSVSSDAVALSDFMVGYVLISEWGKTSVDAVARQVSDSGISFDKLIGAVLGEVDLKKYKLYERLD